MSDQDCITIWLPSSRYKEKEYIFRFIFEDYLGLLIVFKRSESDTVVELANSKKLFLSDTFFSRFSQENYWVLANIPQAPCFSNTPFAPESDIPVLYGKPMVDVSDDSIRCEIDIVASIFFMLTRWEEYANPARDSHNRFPLHASVAYRWGFYKRPIVNEYIEMVWNMLVHLGFSGQRKKRKTQVMVTHDVDDPLRWNSPIKILRSLIGDLVVRKNPVYFLKNLVKITSVLFNRSKDPYDTFDYLMDVSERYHVRSHFFFMAGGTTPYDMRYVAKDKVIRDLIAKIYERGHYVGLHPSYDTCNDETLFKREVLELTEASHLSIRFGRQHYLRFEMPTTWQLWNDNGFEWDSTIGYAEEPGFRSGCCDAYPTFNFLTSTPLVLKEIPLTLMDVSLKDFLFSSVEPVVESVRRYQGTFVLLWHNSNFNTLEWEGAKPLYETIIARMVST